MAKKKINEFNEECRLRVDEPEDYLGVRRTIKRLIFRLTWRRKMCPSCLYLTCVSNWSPCYKCVLGGQWERKNVKEY